MGGVCFLTCVGYPLHCCPQDAHELFQVLLSSLDEELVRVLCAVCCVLCHEHVFMWCHQHSKGAPSLPLLLSLQFKLSGGLCSSLGQELSPSLLLSRSGKSLG